jgi:hypothetical protein
MAEVNNRNRNTYTAITMMVFYMFFLISVAHAVDNPNIIFILTDDQDVTMGGQVCIHELFSSEFQHDLYSLNGLVFSPALPNVALLLMLRIQIKPNLAA